MNSSATLKAEGALQLDGEGVLVRLSAWKGGKEDLTMWQACRSLSYLLFKDRLGGLVEIKGLKALATSVPPLPSSCYWICVSLQKGTLGLSQSASLQLLGKDMFPEDLRQGALSHRAYKGCRVGGLARIREIFCIARDL